MVEMLLEEKLTNSLQRKFASLAEQTKLPVRSICCFLRDKVEEKRAKRYTIQPGGLYEWAVSDIFRWVKEHARQVEMDRRQEEQQTEGPGQVIQMEQTPPIKQPQLLTEEEIEELKRSVRSAGKGMR